MLAIHGYTKTENAYVVFCWTNLCWVCFLIYESVVTPLYIGINVY